MKAAYQTSGQRLARRLLTLFALLVMFFLAFPIVVTVPLSFSDADFMAYPVRGLSLRWYERLYSDPVWSRAIVNTLVIGLAASVLATVLGTAAAWGVSRMQSRLRLLISGLAILPMIVPPIIIALSSYLFFLKTGVSNGYLRVIIGHTVIGIPFVMLVVSSALQSLDISGYRAALSLGARPWLAFRTAILPRISRAMAGGAVLAFATSIDELVISMFLASANERTLPIQMFAGLREQLSPAITSAATLLLLISSIVLLLSTLKRSEP